MILRDQKSWSGRSATERLFWTTDNSIELVSRSTDWVARDWRRFSCMWPLSRSVALSSISEPQLFQISRCCPGFTLPCLRFSRNPLILPPHWYTGFPLSVNQESYDPVCTYLGGPVPRRGRPSTLDVLYSKVCWYIWFLLCFAVQVK